MSIKLKATWLLGLIRVRAMFPKPGSITAKVLFFKVFDTSKDKEKTLSKKSTAGADAENASHAADDTAKEEDISDTSDSTDNSHDKEDSTFSETGKKSITDIISDKYRKIEYTIRNLYVKIKDIYNNIEFYKNLLEEENTKELFMHVLRRLKIILISIRPRRLSGSITFGAATPDITGYVYGIYGMLSSVLGRRFYLNPDFCNEILEGNVYAKGHITAFTVLFNAAMVLFDKKLKILRIKLKRHSLGKDNRKPVNKNNAHS
jgi:hypothetical protein